MSELKLAGMREAGARAEGSCAPVKTYKSAGELVPRARLYQRGASGVPSMNIGIYYAR
jgi:hypothetical protein